jgi:hypothetical protein
MYKSVSAAFLRRRHTLISIRLGEMIAGKKGVMSKKVLQN